MHVIYLHGLNLLKASIAEKIKFIDLTGDCALTPMYLLKLREASKNNKKYRPDTWPVVVDPWARFGFGTVAPDQTASGP